MDKQTILMMLRKSGKYIQKYSPLALSCLASVGVVATAVLAVKTTPKAVRLIEADSRRNHDGNPQAYTTKEAITSAWKCYIPAVGVGLITVVCIMSANALNKHQQVALASACTLVQQSYKEYKDKLKEMYGEETHNAIMDTIMSEKVAEDHTIYAPGGWYESSLDFGIGQEPEVTRTFYDSFTERYFESTVERVIQAEYHLNRNFMLAGIVSLNDFYDFLGLSRTKDGETLGWSQFGEAEFYWIDFDHHIARLEDGMEVYVIDMVSSPTVEFLEDV